MRLGLTKVTISQDMMAASVRNKPTLISVVGSLSALLPSSARANGGVERLRARCSDEYDGTVSLNLTLCQSRPGTYSTPRRSQLYELSLFLGTQAGLKM